MSTLLAVLAEDAETIPYRRRFRKAVGSVTACILLQQMIFRANGERYEPFYKFRANCEHPWCRKGDSWVEELQFGLREFDDALAKIATKIKNKDKEKEYHKPIDYSLSLSELAKQMIIYWTDYNRVTWYWVRVEVVNYVLGEVYRI